MSTIWNHFHTIEINVSVSNKLQGPFFEWFYKKQIWNKNFFSAKAN